MPADDVQLRPMVPADVPAAFGLCRSVLFDAIPDGEEAGARARFEGRALHLLGTDPGGAWVAERGDGICGVAMALLREGVWGLSLYAVAADIQGRGVGRDLLDATLRWGEDAGASGWIVMSTGHPGALRRYALAGFTMQPAVSACGVPDLRRAPAAARSVADAGGDGIETADAIWRHVRGAGSGRDIPRMLEAGARLLLVGERAAVIAREAQVWALAARDGDAAALALWAALLTAPPGATASVDCMTGRQQWAIRTCIEARLDLTPDGGLFTRGRLGPLAPYLPSGAYL